MVDIIRNILNRGKDKNSTIKEQDEMYDLFSKQDKEFELKEKLLEELMSGKYSDNQEFLKHEAFYLGIWKKIEQRQKQKRWHFLRTANVYSLAAALAIGLLIGSIVNFQKPITSNPIYYEAYSPRGSVSEVVLPDGSVIFLNADSKVKYSIDGIKGVREVYLYGEAWFDVAKNKEKPFVVHTPFYDVNVTGTKFNIKTYESDGTLETTLEEGQIIIQPSTKMNLSENLTIKPGEQVVLNKNSGELDVKKVNTQWYTSWKDNKLVFVNMNLKDLVVLLERKYGVEIEVKNTKILALHFDGTIKNESIIEFLEILEKTLPVNFKINGQKVEITDKKLN